jgi:hypothetical protein
MCTGRRSLPFTAVRSMKRRSSSNSSSAAGGSSKSGNGGSAKRNSSIVCRTAPSVTALLYHDERTVISASSPATYVL